MKYPTQQVPLLNVSCSPVIFLFYNLTLTSAQDTLKPYLLFSSRKAYSGELDPGLPCSLAHAGTQYCIHEEVQLLCVFSFYCHYSDDYKCHDLINRSKIQSFSIGDQKSPLNSLGFLKPHSSNWWSQAHRDCGTEWRRC